MKIERNYGEQLSVFSSRPAAIFIEPSGIGLALAMFSSDGHHRML